MDIKEQQELANLIASQVILIVQPKFEQVEEHQRILKGRNGEPSLPELVRDNAKQIQETNSRIKQLYAGVSFVAGAMFVEFLAWVIPKLLDIP